MDYAARATDRVRNVPFINATAITRTAGLLVAALAGPVLLSAVAHAEPDAGPPVVDPAAFCAAPEVGGVLVTDPASPDGVTRSVCQYIVSGRFYYDNFENGAYTGTLMYSDGAKVPTERPQLPEILNMPGNMHSPVVVFPGQF